MEMLETGYIRKIVSNLKSSVLGSLFGKFTIREVSFAGLKTGAIITFLHISRTVPASWILKSLITCTFSESKKDDSSFYSNLLHINYF